MHSAQLSPLLIDPHGRLLATNATDHQVYQVLGTCCDGPNQPCELLGKRLATPAQEQQSRRADWLLWALLGLLLLAYGACRPATAQPKSITTAPPLGSQNAWYYE